MCLQLEMLILPYECWSTGNSAISFDLRNSWREIISILLYFMQPRTTRPFSTSMVLKFCETHKKPMFKKHESQTASDLSAKGELTLRETIKSWSPYGRIHKAQNVDTVHFQRMKHCIQGITPYYICLLWVKISLRQFSPLSLLFGCS